MIFQAVPDPVTNLLGYASGVAAVMVLGAAKKYTTLADTAVGKWVKPIQPWLALVGAVAIPAAARAIGVEVDSQQFTAAPVGTVVAIGAAELLARLQRRKWPRP